VAGTYLFHGRPGVGRWALSIAFGALLNCENPGRSDDDSEVVVPCGVCRSCRLIFALNHEGLFYAVPLPPHKKEDEATDLTNEVLQRKREEPFRLLSSAESTTIPIATARGIKKKLSLKVTGGITRIALFYQMEKMLAASADSLLKLIEEPPEATVIILVAERPESLLPTIQSRAQVVRLHPVPEDAAVGYLVDKYRIPEQKAKLFVRISQGSLGRAIEMIDSSDEEEDSSRRAVGFLLFKSLLTEPSAAVINHMADLLSTRDRGEAEELLLLWQALIRDCVHYVHTGDDDRVVNCDFLADIRKLSTHFADYRIADNMVQDIKMTLADLRRNVHIQGALAALALRFKSYLQGNVRIATESYRYG
jgi:DNA polymerase III delta prime subunit